MKDFEDENRLFELVDGGLITAPLYREARVLGGAGVTAGAAAPVEPIRLKLPVNTYARWGKRMLDLSLIVLSAPISGLVILVCALALWLEGGQPFYRQERLGRDGRRFSILKLRTMICDADQRLEECLAADPEMRREWDATQKLKNDPRITPVGRFLRATSLDELPQLWNVLTGDMSLVGPRPMMPDQLPLYGDARAYFDLRPGITGLWQVSARNETTFSYRSHLDTLYHQNLSLRQDLGLLIRTVGVVIRRTGY